ncbi:FKBP-type peptidyl-prolyl cis-trans isomerase [Schaalia sp. lx-260]|uniref:FKBP-type peptidyl-prolyl cis-trans isomerase n=1 Tax=Schaalia sp. lx-260 TaxID=2899082 RepID=UPI001E2B34EB|nr:FKBP-type peptidyl-prolyl cis-trans isomerase [Schaalia sp. lx-260]MCD4549563.1 FKBP-type peptidyl-prolyl cis-trans isomerase [Schaalia sp. lx-260]
MMNQHSPNVGRHAKEQSTYRRVVWYAGIICVLLLAAAVTFGIVRLLPIFTHKTYDAAQSTQKSPTSFYGIEVSGRVGATPVLTVNETISLTGAKRQVLTRGMGRVIREESPVLLSITAFDGRDGSILSPHGRPQITLGRASTQVFDQEILRAVVGKTEGTRLLYVRYLSEEERAESASPIEIDVIDILYTVAQGSNVDVSTGPMDVTIAPEGPIIRHGETPPDNVTAHPLIRGYGPQVQLDDRLVVQFIATGWTDGIVRDATWSTGVPRMLRLGEAMPGIRQALVDQRVGSRVAITIPPDLAYGDDTLCVLVDILAAEPANDTEESE